MQIQVLKIVKDCIGPGERHPPEDTATLASDRQLVPRRPLRPVKGEEFSAR